jgi:hypothetical protein
MLFSDLRSHIASQLIENAITVLVNDSALVFCFWRRTIASWWLHYWQTRNRSKLRTIFETKHTLCGTLMKTGPGRDAQQTKQCVQHPMLCGRRYIGETRRPLEVCIKEHKYSYNLTQGLLEKSKLAQHAYDEGHKTCRKEAKVLQIEPNTTCRKCKESAHICLIDHPISEPSLDIFPNRTPLLRQK